jgi:hypothetical protein
VGHVKEWARKHNVKQVAFVFETGDEDRGDFERICREEDKIEPAFHGKKDFVPLQAADLIAWKSRHPIREALRDDNDFSVEEAERILASIGKLTAKPYKGGAFDMRSFQKICEQGKIPLRKDRI